MYLMVLEFVKLPLNIIKILYCFQFYLSVLYWISGWAVLKNYIGIDIKNKLFLHIDIDTGSTFERINSQPCSVCTLRLRN